MPNSIPETREYILFQVPVTQEKSAIWGQKENSNKFQKMELVKTYFDHKCFNTRN